MYEFFSFSNPAVSVRAFFCLILMQQISFQSCAYFIPTLNTLSTKVFFFVYQNTIAHVCSHFNEFNAANKLSGLIASNYNCKMHPHLGFVAIHTFDAPKPDTNLVLKAT